MFGLMMDYQLTITTFLRRARQLYPRNEIVTKKPSGEIHRYTYGDMYRRASQLAHALKQLGIEVGDRVGTFCWNHHEHLEMYYAVPCIGAVIHTINIRYSVPQLVYTINHAENKVVFVDASLLPLFDHVAPQLKTVKHFVLVGAPRDIQTTLTQYGEVSHYEDLIAGHPEDFDWPELDERLAAGLCYTSGTTGNPKGCLYTHRSQFIHTLAAACRHGLGIAPDDVVFAVVPMFHANAWGLPYLCAMLGVTQVLPGPHLKPVDLAQLIHDHRVTVAAGVPTLWLGMYQVLKAGNYDVSSVRALVVGGSALPRSFIKAYQEDFGIPVLHAWGMTEMSPMGSTSGLHENSPLAPDEIYDIKARQGAVAPGVEIRIVDDAGDILPWDDQHVGEIQVRGPMIISGYYKDESGKSQFTSDGWFRTGDVATINAEGSMQITDRAKDLIKSGGEWISSVALENALMAHPKVAEAAVIAVPHEKWNERPLALVVAKPDTEATSGELLEFIGQKFAKFQLPDEVRFIKEIPKTSVGKFDKKVLRQAYAEGRL